MLILTFINGNLGPHACSAYSAFCFSNSTLKMPFVKSSDLLSRYAAFQNCISTFLTRILSLISLPYHFQFQPIQLSFPILFSQPFHAYFNVETHERDLKLLEFTIFVSLVLIFGPHTPFRRWTRHSPDRKKTQPD